MATNVKNPTHHSGEPRYKNCTFCGEVFTALGISRHWDRCSKNPNKASRAPSGTRKDLASRITDEILDKGLAKSTWKDTYPDAYENLLQYRDDIYLNVHRILTKAGV